MATPEASSKQAVQDAEYSFPYHYLDLKIPEYELILHVEYRNYLALAKERIGPFIGQTILDIGCGDGRFCYELRHENATVVGVDISQRAIGFARAFNPETEFRVEDIRSPICELRGDSAVLIEVLEHVPPEQADGFLRAVAEALPDAGRLVVTVPSVRLPLAPKHYRHFDESALTQLLGKHFEVVEMVGYSRRGLHWAVFARARGLLRRLLVGWLDRSTLVRRVFAGLARYQVAHFGTGAPESCAGLLAVCVKKPS